MNELCVARRRDNNEYAISGTYSTPDINLATIYERSSLCVDKETYQIFEIEIIIKGELK